MLREFHAHLCPRRVREVRPASLTECEEKLPADEIDRRIAEHQERVAGHCRLGIPFVSFAEWRVRIAALLRERGPLTSHDVTAALGCPMTSFWKSVCKHPWFLRSGSRRGRGGVWSLTDAGRAESAERNELSPS